MNESQLKDFERYAYLVPMQIKRLTPELADNEDFVQEMYAQLIEYISCNEVYVNLSKGYLKGMHVHKAVVLAISKEKKRLQSEIFSRLDCVSVVYDLESFLLADAVENVLKTVSDMERDFLVKRYFHCMTYSEISKEYGMSKDSVRRLENKILKSLRQRSMADKLIDFYV